MKRPYGLIRRLLSGAIVGTLMAYGTQAAAQDVKITPDMPYFEYDNGQDFYVIERNQDQKATIQAPYNLTSRACPPHCIQPMEVAPGVRTIGELELIDFLDKYVTKHKGALIDARLETWYQNGTIPGAVNFAFNVFEGPETNPFLDPVLQILGAKSDGKDHWDFSNALDLAIFCNGPTCGQSPRAITNLLKIGYPAEKIRYYRGGMQAWVSMGLNVVVPGSGS